MSVVQFVWLLLVFVLAIHMSRARWCTRLKIEKHLETFTEITQCTQPYQAKCGWFTNGMCTYYETYECALERNRTIDKIRVIEECCNGYEIDPSNNYSCIRIPEHTMKLYDTYESTLFGLSHGAYAGIICTALFVFCVAILVAIRLHKRQRNAKLRVINQPAENGVTEKMMSAV
ncbi:uncharacterized protein LOC131928807 [Physella acuta]|uniref:uncharacterized protein LOC131928807 n=1 Tax=Physella acuta TaxID=109671 RepID=UPI0027DE4CDD|nr:uncharacterized protein LOC131928807 [Physella acuta]XP_059140922.1 uncharacterized protein LOC131928807 [Physella acuta]XP_059140923.1 uncharacterized protein LOC131928807 [Physella acuta]